MCVGGGGGVGDVYHSNKAQQVPHIPLFLLHLSLPRYASIHQEAPEFVEMNVEQEILETGIKVVDLLAPYAKGGKIGEDEGRGKVTCVPKPHGRRKRRKRGTMLPGVQG